MNIFGLSKCVQLQSSFPYNKLQISQNNFKWKSILLSEALDVIPSCYSQRRQAKRENHFNTEYGGIICSAPAATWRPTDLLNFRYSSKYG